MIGQSPFAKWELIGIPVVVLVGSALHFAFEWSGHWKPLAIMAAVNESVWEHLKLAFWPSLFWALLGYAFFKPSALAFLSAKGYALLVAPVLIVVIFYGYTAILGGNFLVFDITTFVLAIAAGQFVSAKLLAAKSRDSRVCAIGAGLLLCQIAAYSTLTFHPPPFALFEDGRNGIRGIPPRDNLPVVPFHSRYGKADLSRVLCICGRQPGSCLRPSVCSDDPASPRLSLPFRLRDKPGFAEGQAPLRSLVSGLTERPHPRGP